MTNEELRAELRRILPEGHPVLENLTDARLDRQVEEMVADLVDNIDDWKRGVRDWNEVEPHLVLVRDEVKPN
jgi:hypothetical protein